MSSEPRQPRHRVGRVIAGSGSQYLVILEPRGGGFTAVSAGDVLIVGGEAGGTLDAPSAPCIGLVTGLSVPAPQPDADADEIRIAEIDLCGTLTADGFTRGVNRAPTLGDVAWQASEADLTILYGATEASIGTVSGYPSLSAGVEPDRLAQGFGILGAQDSGKSATLAVLTRALIKARAPVRPLLIDTHDEFTRSFGRAARIVRPGKGFLPHWLLTFDELSWILSLNGGPLSDEERALLADAVPAARVRMLQRQGATQARPIGLDNPLPYRVTDAISYLDKTFAADGQRAGPTLTRLRARLAAAVADPRTACVFGSLSAEDTLGSLLGDLFGLAKDAPAMTVVQLGSLDHGLDRLVTAVLCRLAVALGKGVGGSERVLLLMEDVDRFAPAVTERRGRNNEVVGSELLSRRAILDLVAAAGAGGASIGVTTSRPSLVDEQVLRAIPTLLVHRTASEVERERVALVLPEGSAAAIDAAATLPAGDCIALGRGVPAPGRYTIAKLPQAAVPTRIASQAPNLAREALAEAIIERWRYATPASGPTASVRPPRQTAGTGGSVPHRPVPAA